VQQSWSVQQLGDLEELRALKARYFRALDGKRWPDLRDLFTADATFEHPVLGRFDDIDEAIGAVSARVGNYSTVHTGNLPEIRMTGENDAVALWSMSSVTFQTDGGGGPAVVQRTWGEYKDSCRREHGCWRISALTLVSALRQGPDPGRSEPGELLDPVAPGQDLIGTADPRVDARPVGDRNEDAGDTRGRQFGEA
jgi:hypothetical protein